MTFEIHDAVRQDIRLLTLLAGGTGSGKTESAMRLATGLAGGQPFAVIDTENGRALHKADDYAFKHVPFEEPFSPERYTEAVQACADFPVIVIDSGSHEYDGPGGVLDIQAEEFERGGRQESKRMSSWIVPKQRHKRFVQALLRSPAHVILCLRAEDKIEIVKDAEGKTVVRPKETLTGAQGWVPIVERRLPFEATISLLLLQDNPGVPVPIKLERRHVDLVPLDRPLDESVGAALAAWAKGSSAEPGPTTAHPAEGAGGSGTEPAPSAPAESGASPLSTTSNDVAPSDAPASSRSMKPTKRQLDKLNVLVVGLREANAISTANLWAALAKARSVDVDMMIELLHGRDEEGVLHWGPLIPTITRGEASDLIDRLERLEANVGAAA